MMDEPRSGTATYVSLRSFKRDGGAVDTPVWAAPLDGTLVVFTLRDSFKVKRIRRNPHVQVAPCGVFGAVSGAWVDGTCRLVEDTAHEARAYARREVRLADAARHVDASPRRRPRATGDPRDRARRLGRLTALPHESIVTESVLVKSGLSRPTAVPTRTESVTWSVT